MFSTQYQLTNLNTNNGGECKTKCPGFEMHVWKKRCKHCSCSKEDHNIDDEKSDVKLRIGQIYDGFLQYSKSKNSKKLNSSIYDLESKYDWYPSDINTELFEKYLHSIPRINRPIKNSIGSLYRKKQIEIQLPLHDFDKNVCDSIISDHEKFKFNEFINKYQKNSIGIGEICENLIPNVNCSKCNELMSLNEISINTSYTIPDTQYHTKCFKCTTCNELLVDLVYFYKNKQIYCGRHFAEKIRKRCAACDELIFSNEYTKAENQFWHLIHFCCWKCDSPLGGEKYLTIDSKPFCIQCYNVSLAKECDTCHQKITAECKRFTHNDINWHANSTCFSCFACRNSLIQQPFIFKNGYVFCSIECKQRIIPKNSETIGDVIQF